MSLHYGFCVWKCKSSFPRVSRKLYYLLIVGGNGKGELHISTVPLGAVRRMERRLSSFPITAKFIGDTRPAEDLNCLLEIFLVALPGQQNFSND